MQNVGLFTKTEYVSPSIPPKAKWPKCYEQMSKLRFTWWASWTEIDDRGLTVKKETGPFASYAAACAFSGR